MHADLYWEMVDQLLAEALAARDPAERGRLIEQAADYHAKAVMAAKGEWVPNGRVWRRPKPQAD